MSSVPFLYRAAVRVARRLAPLAASGASKIARGIRGRRGAVDELVRWGREARDPSRPTVWFHAPSVGEGLQAGAVMEALRDRVPDVQLAFTHFSPSAEGLGERLGADVSAYLPWDVPEDTGRALDALAPALLAFTRTEVWPVLAEEAGRRGIPVGLVGAVLGEDAGRLGWPARLALGSTWKRLDLACARAEADAKRLVSLGVAASAVRVTGDPGIDSAAERLAEADPGARYLAPFAALAGPVVVAGSTWPEDEEVLLEAWERLAHEQAFGSSREPAGGRAGPGSSPLLVVAPHEPTTGRVRELLALLRGRGLSTVTLAEAERRGSIAGVDAVIVDRVGVLAHLYSVGSVAYVGGGFGRDGLHSVLEPAAAGVPTLFGPRHSGAPSAAELVEAGAAQVVADSGALESALRGWLEDSDAKNRAARAALDYIGAHRGAADRTADILESLLRTTNTKANQDE